jgi:hypothetical protein
MAAPALVSPKVTSFTIVFSSTTVPHLMQNPFPAAVSYSMTFPPQSLQVACRTVDDESAIEVVE